MSQKIKSWLNFANISGVVIATSILSCSTTLAADALRIGMSTSDIPRISGQPDQGYAGNLFTGMTLFDALTQWDLSKSDQVSEIIPGLALSWQVDATDKTKWIYQLRPGVKFHDGSDFNADAVVWNVDKVANPQALQFDPGQSALTMNRMPSLKSARKIDDLTVEITTTVADSSLPINLSNLFIASPGHWQQAFDQAESADAPAKTKSAWASFERNPSGTGPWKFDRVVPRERLEMTRNTAYWDKNRVPKLDRLVLFPIPDSNARVSALMAGQLDWIESPPPDALDQLRGRGFEVLANEQPHLWPWHLSYHENSPWADIRVRQAANLCIDREGMAEGLLKGLMVPATGWWEEGHPWAGKPDFKITYDLERGQSLMKEANYGPDKPAKVKALISNSGSGQMQPIAMNEYLQQALAECYIDVQLQTVDWNALLASLRSGASDSLSNGANALNVSFPAMDPMMVYKLIDSKFTAPVGANWGGVNNPKIDALITTARTSFEPAALDKALADLHTEIVDQALFLFVGHDVGARAISPKVSGVVQPKNWFIDLSSAELKP